jgi:ketosteroid isomerase-like protein
MVYMARTMCAGVALLVVAACGVGFAQDDAAAVKTAVDSFLAAAKAADTEALGELLHDSFVFVDPDTGVKDTQGFIDGVVDDPAPADMSLGEYEPEMYGDVALALPPLNMPAEIPMDVDVRLGLLLMRTGGEWQLLALWLLIPGDTAEAMPAPERQGLEQARKQLEEFLAELEQQAAEGGPIKLFLDQCIPDACLAGPYGPDGSMVAGRASMVRGFVGDQEGGTIKRAEEPKEFLEIGPGCGFVAINVEAAAPGGQATPMRRMILATYIDQENGWKVAASVTVPLE